MKTKLKKALSLALAFVLILGLLPIGAVARAEEAADLELQATNQALEIEPEAAIPAVNTEPETTELAQETGQAKEVEVTEEATTAPTETEAALQGTEATEAAEETAQEETTPAAEEAQGLKKAPRAGNQLHVWGSYVMNQDTQYWFGSTWCYGLERLDLDGTAAFCIEPSIRTTSQTYSKYNTGYAKEKLGERTYEAVSLVLAYGWPNTSYTNQNTGYSMLLPDSATWQETEKWAATQTIVWEFVLGYRNTSVPYACTDRTLYNRYHSAAWGNTWDTYVYVYNQIEQKLAKHNQAPSFTSRNPSAAPTYEMTYNEAGGNYKLTLTDTKGILSSYSLDTSISGVTFSKSGNTLTITATPTAAEQLQDGVSCRLSSSSILDIDPDKVTAVWGKPGQQTVVTPVHGTADPARAYFKLKAAAASTARVIKKNSEAGGQIANFIFELRDSTGKVLDTKVTDGNGNLTFDANLVIGNTYTIHEVAAAGFVVQPDQSFTAKAGDNVVTFTNAKVYGNVQVVKVDRETGDHLTGAVFKIYQDSNGNGILDDIDLVSAIPMEQDSDNPGVYHLDHLPYGTYHLRETQAPEGYVLDETVYSFAITEDGKTVVVETTAGSGVFENQKIYGGIQGLKLDRETGETISGAVFGLFRAEETSFTEDTALMTAESNENGVFVFENVVYGGYVVRELKPAEGYLPNEESYPVTVDEDGETIEITVVNDRIPEIRTTATVDGQKEVFAAGVIALTDTVSYQHLVPGKEYTVTGILMDKKTGEPFFENEKQITADVTFIPEAPSGSVDVLFTVDASLIQTNTSLVVFESLYQDGRELAIHADLEDGGQTVTVYVPEIRTTATVNGKKEITAAKQITLEDVVSYTSLIPGREYTVKGILMDKSTGKPFLVDGKEITSQVKFTPDAKDGQIAVQFMFDASGITRSTKLVVFENVYHEDVEIAVHADINDEGQTVTITPPQTPPNTGDNSNLVLWGSLLTLTLMALAGIAVLTLRKKKQ